MKSKVLVAGQFTHNGRRYGVAGNDAVQVAYAIGTPGPRVVGYFSKHEDKWHNAASWRQGCLVQKALAVLNAPGMVLRESDTVQLEP